MDSEVQPKTLPCRRIPISLKDKVKVELDTLVQRGIIVPIEEPTPWVSQMAVVKKPNGKLLICIDPQPLNEALQREHYKMPTLDDVLPSLHNAKVFSKLDVKEAFWHIRLDEDSSRMTTMITPFGRYRWQRLPFGLKVSSEVFQKRLTDALCDLEGVVCVADDIIVVGVGETKEKAEKDHDRKLMNLQRRCKERNIKLNEEKAAIKQTEIPFIGHLITKDGVLPNNDRISAILNMPDPKDIHDVKRLCGMIQYMAKFLPNLAEDLEPIRKLTRKEEKETLAVVYGLERFDQYTYGRNVKVQNDHKPLEQILKKPLNQAPRRIQALLMRLYRYDVTFEYVPGNKLIIADTLSRAFVETDELDQFSNQRIMTVYDMLEDLPDARCEEIRQATVNDPLLQRLINIIKDGWPDNKYDLPEELRPYFAIRDTLNYNDNLVVNGERIVVPKSLQNDMKKRLHTAHLGYDSMIRRARKCIYWCGMAKDIKQVADNY